MYLVYWTTKDGNKSWIKANTIEDAEIVEKQLYNSNAESVDICSLEADSYVDYAKVKINDIERKLEETLKVVNNYKNTLYSEV